MLEQNQIDIILPKLQEILRIQDWDIEVVLMDSSDFYAHWGTNDQGHNEITRVINASYITINKTYSEDNYRTLVHELIRLVFDHLETCETLIYLLNNKQVQQSVDDVFMIALERTVERMSQIFISIYTLEKILDEVKK